MRGWLTGIVGFMLMVNSALGQTGVSIYHLGDRLIQNNFENPSLMPRGRFFVGIPVLSGVRLNYINRLSYNEAIIDNEDGEAELDIDRLISNLDDNNLIYSSGVVTIAYLGTNLSNGGGITAFVREKYVSSVNLPKSVVEFAWFGNVALNGQPLVLNDLKADNRYYREYGLGYSHPLGDQLRIGGRFKVYQGLLAATTDDSFNGRVQTNPEDFTLNFSMQNARIHTAGLEAESSYFLFNGNYGFGADIGVDWTYDKFNVNAAIRDIGAIRWRSNTTTYGLNDSDFTYRGVSFATVDDLIEEVQDSLLDKFQDYEEIVQFTTRMNISFLLNGSYRPWEKGAVHGTMVNTLILDQPRTTLALGYTHDFSSSFSLSGTVTKLPQQFVNFGLAARIEAGPVQFYLGTDKIFGNYNLTDVEALNLRFGANLIFGEQRDKNDIQSERPAAGKIKQTKEKPYKPPKHKDHPNRGVSKPKVKGRDGIYTITGRQKKVKRPKHKRIKEGSNKGKNKRYKQKRRKNRKRN